MNMRDVHACIYNVHAYIYIYIYMRVCLFACVHVRCACVDVCVCVYIYIYICACVCLFACVDACIYIYMLMCVCVCVCVYLHACIGNMHACMRDGPGVEARPASVGHHRAGNAPRRRVPPAQHYCVAWRAWQRPLDLPTREADEGGEYEMCSNTNPYRGCALALALTRTLTVDML